MVMLTQMVRQCFQHFSLFSGSSLRKVLSWASLALVLSAVASSASATPSWQVQSIIPATDGTGRVLWVKPGTQDSNGVSSGDIASVWSLDAKGNETAMGPSYGPYPGWTAQETETTPDGTTRLLWVKPGTYDSSANYTGDTVSVWTLNNKGVVTAKGSSYGPFTGWTNAGFDVVKDSTLHLYWNKYDVAGNSGDSISVWRLNAAGTAISQGPAYSLLSGWSVNGVLEAADDTLRVQWVKPGTSNGSGTYSGDQTSVWTLNTNGVKTAVGPTYGPYSGWRTYYFVAPDKTGRLNWIKRAPDDTSGDTVSVWTLDATGKATAQGPSYGPYPGWQSYGAAVAPDSTARLFWVTPGTTETSGDKVSLWTLDRTGKATAQGPAYGPFAGWTTGYYQIAPDGTSRLNWIKSGTTDTGGNYSGDTVSGWTLNASGVETAIGPAYGPYPNWTAEFLYPATNSLSYLVWQHGSSQYSYFGDEFSIWSLNAANTETFIGPTYGPF